MLFGLLLLYQISYPMKVLLLILISLLTLKPALGQLKNINWTFGDHAGLNFVSGNPVPFHSATVSRGSCASISNSDGDLLFYMAPDSNALFTGYTKNVQIYNIAGQIMNGGDSLIGLAWYNELVILPNPASDSLFYAFSIGVTTNYGLYFHQIDLSLNSGLGEVVNKNIQLLDSQMVDCLTAVKHGNGRDWWILARTWQSSTGANSDFLVYLLDENGIVLHGIQSIGSLNNTNGAQLCFNSLGNEFAFSNLIGLIEKYDFDRCSGQISNPVLIEPQNNFDPPLIFGLAYSPDGTKLYVSHAADTTFLYQYDLRASNIRQSKRLIYTFHDYDNAGGQLRLAPDGKIYFSMAWNPGGWNYPYPDTSYNVYNNNLSVIHQPNLSGTACDFRPFSFNLGGGRTYWGLPNNPDYELGPLRGSICDTILTSVAYSGGELENEIILYPNPVRDKLILKLTPVLNPAEIRIYNVLGQKQQLPVNATNEGEYMEIDTRTLIPGLYYVELLTSGGKTVRRFVKE